MQLRALYLVVLVIAAASAVAPPKAPKPAMMAQPPDKTTPAALAAPPTADADADESQPAVSKTPLARPVLEKRRPAEAVARPVLEKRQSSEAAGMAESLEGAREQLDKLEHPMSPQEKLGATPSSKPQTQYNTYVGVCFLLFRHLITSFLSILASSLSYLPIPSGMTTDEVRAT
jgi:hypothetical protein